MKFYVTNAASKKIEDEGIKVIYSLDQLLALAKKYNTSIVITLPEDKCDYNYHDEFPTLLIVDYYLG